VRLFSGLFVAFHAGNRPSVRRWVRWWNAQFRNRVALELEIHDVHAWLIWRIAGARHSIRAGRMLARDAEFTRCLHRVRLGIVRQRWRHRSSPFMIQRFLTRGPVFQPSCRSLCTRASGKRTVLASTGCVCYGKEFRLRDHEKQGWAVVAGGDAARVNWDYHRVVWRAWDRVVSA